ncbi:MAG: hypothetical protein P8Z80_03140 [Pseudolabrys sp.]
MIRHNLAHWPLVLSAVRGSLTQEDQLAFFAEWAAWFDRGGSFATLRVFVDADSLTRPQGGGKEAKAWLQANAERLKTQVLGMATVVPPIHFEEMSRMNAEKLFGVPARTFEDPHKAISWLNSLLIDRYVDFDLRAAEKSLEGLVFALR